MAAPVQGVPEGLTEEALKPQQQQSAPVEGVPEGLTEEPISGTPAEGVSDQPPAAEVKQPGLLERASRATIGDKATDWAMRPFGSKPAPAPAAPAQAHPAQAEPSMGERFGSAMAPALNAAAPALETINKYAVQPFEKMSQFGAKKGAELADQAVTATEMPWERKAEAEHPMASQIGHGITRGIGSMVGGIAADPRQWPLMAAAEVGPAFQKLMSGGFAGMMGEGTMEAAKNLYQNWDKMTPEQRSEEATRLGLSAYFTKEAAGHAAPEVVKAAPEAIRAVMEHPTVKEALPTVKRALTKDATGAQPTVQEASDQEVLSQNIKTAQDKLDPLQKQVDAHRASLAQGVPLPEKLDKAYRKAKADVQEAQQHMEIAQRTSAEARKAQFQKPSESPKPLPEPGTEKHVPAQEEAVNKKQEATMRNIEGKTLRESAPQFKSTKEARDAGYDMQFHASPEEAKAAAETHMEQTGRPATSFTENIRGGGKLGDFPVHVMASERGGKVLPKPFGEAAPKEDLSHVPTEPVRTALSPEQMRTMGTEPYKEPKPLPEPGAEGLTLADAQKVNRRQERVLRDIEKAAPKTAAPKTNESFGRIPEPSAVGVSNKLAEAPKVDTEAERLKETVGKSQASDNDFIAQAKKELGDKANLSDIIKKSVELREAAAKPTAEAPKAAEEVPKPKGQGAVPAGKVGLKVTHHTNVGDLETTEPGKQGSGKMGAERGRAKEPGYLPRTYFYEDAAGVKEPRIQGQAHKYTADLDPSKIYDADKDPEGIWKNTTDTDENSKETEAERFVKNSGYQGYKKGGVVASFEPVKVTKAEPTVAEGVSKMAKESGRSFTPGTKVDVDKAAAEKRADAYDAMRHDPEDPKVKASYKALIEDAKKQWDYITNKLGIKIEPTDKDPYDSYEAMKRDVEENKHLSVWRGGNPLEPGHPLSKTDLNTGENYNTMFRAVHDIIGHVAGDNDFSEKGEENAYKNHVETLSPEAKGAAQNETQGQVSWFFNNKDVRGGKAVGAFPEQKAGILPEEGAANHAQNIADITAEKGGATYNPKDGDMAGKDAYAVPVRPDLSSTVEGEKPTAEQIQKFMDRPAVKKALADDPRLSVGTWAKDGKTYLDLSAAITDREEATALGRLNNQRAITYLKTLEDIPTGGTGTGKPLEPTSEDWKAQGFTDAKQVSQVSNQLGHPDGLADFLNEAKGREAATKLGAMTKGDWKAYAEREYGADHGFGNFDAKGEDLKAAKKAFAERLMDEKTPQEVLDGMQKSRMEGEGPAPKATMETAKMDTAELLKKGFTQEEIDKGKHIPAVSGASMEEAKTKGIPEEIAKHMTEAEIAGITKSNKATSNFLDKMAKVPAVQEYVDIANLGEGARKWYQRSTKAFEAMASETPKYFDQEGDREKFVGLLAATSPRQSVAMNMREALGAWKAYVDAGRPEGSSLRELLYKNLTLPGAKVPNAELALSGKEMWPDLSKNAAFKAPSFEKNLKGYLNYVTNDGWMALFGGMSPGELQRPTSYHPLSIVTRAAAESLGWEPAEAQAAIWSFTQALTESQGAIRTPEEVRAYSQDFVDILKDDQLVRDLLADLGVSHEQLDAKLDAIGEKPEVTGRTTPTAVSSVGELERRIEEARGKGALPKSKQGAFQFREEHPVRSQLKDKDTEFNPEELEEKPKYSEKRKEETDVPRKEVWTDERRAEHVRQMTKDLLSKDNPFNKTEGAMDTINRDLERRGITQPGAKYTGPERRGAIKNIDELKEASKSKDGATIIVTPDGTVHSTHEYMPDTDATTHSSLFNNLLAFGEGLEKYVPEEAEGQYETLEQADWSQFMEDGGIRAAVEDKNRAFANVETTKPETVKRALDVLDNLGRKHVTFEFQQMDQSASSEDFKAEGTPAEVRKAVESWQSRGHKPAPKAVEEVQKFRTKDEGTAMPTGLSEAAAMRAFGQNTPKNPYGKAKK